MAFANHPTDFSGAIRPGLVLLYQMTEPKQPYDFTLDLKNPVGTHAIQFRLIPKKSRVLDVGCHTGILGESLMRNRSCAVVGVDSNIEVLEIADQRLSDTLHLDLEQPGWAEPIKHSYPDGFDVLLFGDVLEHTRHPETILLESRALLRDSGTIVASLPNIANLRIRLQLLFGKFDYGDHGILDRTHYKFFTKSSAKQMIEGAGYKIEALIPAGYSLPKFVLEAFPSLFAVQFVIQAVKDSSDKQSS